MERIKTRREFLSSVGTLLRPGLFAIAFWDSRCQVWNHPLHPTRGVRSSICCLLQIG
jgi:hypothetical protein